MKIFLVIVVLIAAAIGGAMYYDHRQQEKAAQEELGNEADERAEELLKEINEEYWREMDRITEESKSPRNAVEIVLKAWRDGESTWHDRSNKKLMSPSKWEIRSVNYFGDDGNVRVYVTSSTQGGHLIHKDWVFLLSKNQEEDIWQVHTIYDPNRPELR